jgi:membrane protein DedA with SNARE-associated domain
MTRIRQIHHLLLPTKFVTMFEQLVLHISQYGYLAIFLLVFLQEVGVPNPIPNELVLLFSGYLSSTGTLNVALVILCAIAGDLLGSTILYITFYFFGKIIVTRKPRWIPLPTRKLEQLSEKIRISGHSGIFIGRLTPFIKGYVSVLSGLMHIAPTKYGVTLLLSSIIWALAYISCGYFAGPYWNWITQHSNTLQYMVICIAAPAIFIVVLRPVFKRLLSTTK